MKSQGFSKLRSGIFHFRDWKGFCCRLFYNETQPHLGGNPGLQSQCCWAGRWRDTRTLTHQAKYNHGPLYSPDPSLQSSILTMQTLPILGLYNFPHINGMVLFPCRRPWGHEQKPSAPIPRGPCSLTTGGVWTGFLS